MLQVANLVPSPGVKLTTGAALQFDVLYDDIAPPGVKLRVGFERFEELAFDGAFLVPYASSTRAAISNGWRFTLRRAGAWPAQPRIGVDYITAGPVFGAGPYIDWNPILDLSQSYSMRFIGEGEPCVVALSRVNEYKLGSQISIFIPAGTANELRMPSAFGALRPEGYPVAWDDWSDTSNYQIVIFGSDPTTGAVYCFGRRVEVVDLTPPTITGVAQDPGSTSRIIVTGDEELYVGGVVGLSITGSVRTVTSVYDGNGTADVTLALSGALEVTPTTLVVASVNQIQAMNGTPMGAQSVSITGGATEPALASLTLDVIASENNGGIANGAACAVWGPRTGSSTTLTIRQTTAGDRPILNTTGINGTVQSLDGDGSSDFMILCDAGGTPVTLSSLLAGSGTGWGLCGIVRVDAATSIAAPIDGSDYGLMTGILVDSLGYFGLFVNGLGGGQYELVMYCFTSSAVFLRSYDPAGGGTSNALGRFTLPGKRSFAVRHDGTNLKMWMGDGSTPAVEVASIAMGAAIGGLTGNVYTHRGQGAAVFSDIGINSLRVASANWSDPENTQQLAWYQSRLALP